MSTSDRDFATEWVQAWNSHDLERVLSHYDDTVTLISPRAQLVLGIADGAVRGKAALRDYIKRALENVPDLSFTLERVFSGVNSVVIEFQHERRAAWRRIDGFCKEWPRCPGYCPLRVGMNMIPRDTGIESHTIVVTVDNEPGVLARVIGLFAGRGYNIESLTVAEVDRAAHTSRITVVTSGTPAVIEQIKAQLGRLVPVHRVVDLTVEKPGIEREMALVKVAGTGDKRVEAMRVSQVFRAKVLDTTHSSFVFEVTGAPAKIDAFIELMRPLGLVEVSRTGVAAISRGAEAM